MSEYKLLDIPLKQSFANSGIKQRVPYTLPAADDDLNWLEGFTDAYQRPVISDNLGEKSGRYIRMGQINQILENVSQAILNVKQSLDNVADTIDKDIKVEIDKVITDSNNALENKNVVWLQTIGNQTVAGLKNFTGVNINNFKNSPRVVANLEWCNGIPIKIAAQNYRTDYNVNFTMTRKAIAAMTFNIDRYHITFMQVNKRDVSVSDTGVTYHFKRIFPSSCFTNMYYKDILSYRYYASEYAAEFLKYEIGV